MGSTDGTDGTDGTGIRAHHGAPSPSPLCGSVVLSGALQALLIQRLLLPEAQPESFFSDGKVIFPNGH